MCIGKQMQTFIIIIAVAWLVGTIVAGLLYKEEVIDGDEAFWWPITLMKVVIKSFIRVVSKW